MIIFEDIFGFDIDRHFYVDSAYITGYLVLPYI